MHKSIITLPAIASALLLGAAPQALLAQRTGGGTAASQRQPAPRGDLDRTRDQERLRDLDTTADKDRDQDRLRDRDATGDQDRDRLRTSQVIDRQLSTLSLLTSDERARFQNEMRNATTAEERNRIRADHQKKIQERARELGIETPVGAGAPMGLQTRGGYMLMTMLTDQERAQFMNRMHSSQSAQERQRIRTEMQTLARERAREMGVNVPEWYGRGPASR